MKKMANCGGKVGVLGSGRWVTGEEHAQADELGTLAWGGGILVSVDLFPRGRQVKRTTQNEVIPH